uniref:PAX-interacting protein 1 n=1 Tax=Schistosoma mansoni TaxID=6183 RepID=A0A5K4F3C0_SCHMA
MEQSVFKDAKFFIISCNHKEVVDLLKSLGAVSHPFLSESVRFAISDDPSLAEVGEAEELYAVPVVTSHWVKLSVEAQKFLPFRPFHPDFKHIFAGTVITCSGLSVADQLSIWAHVTIHGGQMCHYLDKSVTHVVVAKAAGNFYKYCTNKLANDNDACDENNSKPFIVTPDWIVDCLSQNNLLPCTSYHPDLLVCTTSLSSPSKQTCLKKPQQQLNEPKELDLCHANSSINDSIKEENNLINNSALTNDSIIHGNNNNIVVEVIGTTTLTSNANITATTNSNIVNRTNTSQLPPPIPPPQQQQSQIHTSKQYLVQTNQLTHHTLQSTHQLSTVLSGGTNVQAATGISVQQINMKNVDQKSQFGSGLSPIPPNKPGRGGHSRGGSGSGSGRGSSKKASQDQFRSGSQQQQQQRRFSLSPPVPNRYPVAPNVGAVSGGGGISSHRFALNRPQSAVAQRYPSTSSIYTDPAVQQGLMQQTGGSDAHGNPISLGTNYSTSSVSTNHTNVILTNSLLPTTTSTTTLGGHSVIGSNSGGGGSNTITLTTSLTATTGVNAINNITGNSGGGCSNSGGGASSVSTTTTTSTTTTGHHGKTSKSKSSKHMQEQNLNEEEKDAIVMQNVKNILSLQHTWNRESSHGRGSSSASSSEAHSSNSNTGHNQNGPNSFSGPQGGNPSNLSNLINSSYGSSSNLTNSQISGSHRKPKSPKSPCRAVGVISVIKFHQNHQKMLKLPESLKL